MRIVEVAPPIASTPPNGHGGTERVVSFLERGLVEAGHQVTVLASGDSQTSGRLVPITDVAIRNLEEAQDPLCSQRLNSVAMKRAVRFIAENADDFDVVHNNFYPEPFFVRMLQRAGCTLPRVSTLHLPPGDRRDIVNLQAQLPDEPVISISDAQRKGAPGLNYVATVYNGIPVPDEKINTLRNDGLVYVGSMNPKKNPLDAIRVANLTGRPLTMLARVDPPYKDWYEAKIKPQIDANSDIDFIGEVPSDKRDEIVGQSYALIFPIKWHEPFGLVVVEAMAVGTPVITTRWGAMPELVVDGETGFLCDTLSQMVRAVDNLEYLDPQACLARVLGKFTIPHMVQGYETVFDRVLQTA